MFITNILVYSTEDELIHCNDLRQGMVIQTLGKEKIGDGHAKIFYVDYKNTDNKYEKSINCERSIPYKLIPIESDCVTLLRKKLDNEVGGLRNNINMILNKE